jgi:hypothetical protein
MARIALIRVFVCKIMQVYAIALQVDARKGNKRKVKEMKLNYNNIQWPAVVVVF